MNADFLLVSDDKYVKNLGVSTYSVLYNMCPVVDRVRIFVMDCGITEENKLRLQRQTGQFENAEIIFYNIEKQLDSVVPKVKTKWHRAIYGRLFFVELLEIYSDIDRLIYLDCDLVMDQPVTELYEMDMKGKCLAAVVDADAVARLRALNIPDGAGYINSGVLLIDVKKWAELDVSRKCIEYINSFTTELEYPDQDAINYILQNQIITLPPQYNMMWMICDRDIKKMLRNVEGLPYTAEEIHFALHNGKIYHYAGHDMWSMYNNTPIHVKAFLKYKNMSDWKNERRRFKNPREFVMGTLVAIVKLIRGEYSEK